MSGIKLVGLTVSTVVGIGSILALAVSNRVRYQERVIIHASPEDVFRAIQFQETLMAWSAWPSATNSTCHVVGTDGTIGATVEYLTKGKVSGSQTVTEIVPGERVTVQLADPSPFGQQPFVTFIVHPRGSEEAEVVLDFANTIRRPFHLLLKGSGIVRWVQDLHRKDLASLKAFCERQSITIA